VLGSLLGGLGYATWIIVPSYAGFALGFILWGASSALISGTFEAHVYDELAARGSTGRYAALIGKAKAAALVLNLAATALAAPLYQSGGYVLVGVVSVLSCLRKQVSRCPCQRRAGSPRPTKRRRWSQVPSAVRSDGMR